MAEREHGGGLGPQELMHEIRSRVRGGSGAAAGGRASISGSVPAHAPADPELQDLFHLADVDVPREVRTHRPFLGAYVRLRRWVLREVRLTVDPILARQVALNRALVRLVAEQQERIAELEERLGGGSRP